jgi:capsular polysaccharide biosynthesis protein
MSNFSVKKLKNVSVTNNAVIINKGRIVKDSCVREECHKKYRGLKFRLKYFFPIFSNNKKSYILTTDEWSKNYCHFLWEALSKLIDLKKSAPDATLVLQKSYLKIDFMVKALEAFGCKAENVKVIPKRSHLRVKNLSFIPCINIATAGYYDYLKFSEISQTLVSYYQEKLKTNYGERIYISRSDPKKNTARKIANEDELVKMLAKQGFKTVYMENFSFLEQISIMNFARYIVAPHGAGITNVMFAKKDSFLFELVNKRWEKTCFAEMCERMAINYLRFDCEEIDNGENMELRDIKIKTSQLEEKLTKILR